MSGHFKLNKGEWSEIYVFLKLLIDGNLKGTTSKLSYNQSVFPISHIIQPSFTGKSMIHYYPRGNFVEIIADNQKKNIDIKIIKDFAAIILNKLNQKQTRTFEILNFPVFHQQILSPRVKSPNYQKRDLTIVLQGSNLALGFSVKSNIAGKSTLLNASEGTNFRYTVAITDNDFQVMKNLKCKSLMAQLNSKNININYTGMVSPIYQENLEIFSAQMPAIIGNSLLNYYSIASCNRLQANVNHLIKTNPLNLNPANDYQDKFLNFLMDTALGMVPQTKWNQVYDSDGGVIVVDNQGELYSFYIKNPQLLAEFKTYLLSNTFFDTASTTRHKFGSLYKDNNQILLKLNLQIRLD